VFLSDALCSTSQGTCAHSAAIVRAGGRLSSTFFSFQVLVHALCIDSAA